MALEIREAFSILERTPRILRALLEGLSEPWIVDNEGEDTFSPRDVVGHLILGERTDWIGRAEIILEHGESKPFEPFDRFAFRERDVGKSFAELLDEFESLRGVNLERARSFELGAEELARRGTHPELGTVTLSQLLATWAVHDLGHIRQITRVMAKRYREEVGPWKEYLRILSE